MAQLGLVILGSVERMVKGMFGGVAAIILDWRRRYRAHRAEVQRRYDCTLWGWDGDCPPAIAQSPKVNAKFIGECRRPQEGRPGR